MNQALQQKIIRLKELLQIEKKEDLEQYKQKLSSTSLKERRKEGVCWYPVQLEKTKYDAGERLLIRVSRFQEHKYAHQFQSGKLVSVFSASGGKADHEQSVNGVVNQVGDSDMIITLTCDDLPEWIRFGNLGIQLLFDENSYREMEKSLDRLLDEENNRSRELVDCMLGDREPQFTESYPFSHPRLNESQNEAMNRCLAAEDVAIIHGPPGTGKTTTLVHSILQILKDENQILVCAPSNAAVDLMAEKLNAEGVQVLRIGHPARVTDEILSMTLDARVTQHLSYKDLKSLKRRADEFRNMALKFKRTYGKTEREQKRLMFKEADSLRAEVRQLEFFISSDIIAKAQVIVCTLVGAANQTLSGIHFNTVVIDEAAQALEPACWIPIQKGQRIIFAGDHHQLPPTIKSYVAARDGLSQTLFEKVIQNKNVDSMLETQYRMHADIMGFSAEFFYKNALKAAEQVANWKVFDQDKALEFIDTAGCGFYETKNQETRSSYNPEEVDLLIKHLSSYLNEVENKDALRQLNSIGIISPYKAQANLIKSEIQQTDFIPEHIKNQISVNTVDSFQGQEKDVIYISLVRCNEEAEIGFLTDIRRMNVAITRARKKLVVIGDSGTIGQHPFYQQFLDYVNAKNAYRSAFEIVY